MRSYTADLVQLEKTYYGAGRDTQRKPIPLTGEPAIANDFDESGLVTSVRAIQKGEIGYAEFLRRIMRSGCATYSVYIGGRKAVYSRPRRLNLYGAFPRREAMRKVP